MQLEVSLVTMIRARCQVEAARHQTARGRRSALPEEEVIVTSGKFGEPWPKADLFFLRDALTHGMPPADVARYLRRTEDEVRERGRGMPRRRTRPSPRDGQGSPLWDHRRSTSTSSALPASVMPGASAMRRASAARRPGGSTPRYQAFQH